MATKLQLSWLKSMVTAAQLTQRKYGVPASVTLAQCILESAWGTSQLSRRANNYFGVKSIQGQDYAEFTTREVVSGRSVVELARFARYPSAIESFEAHAKLIAKIERYRPAMAVLPDVEKFCYQIQGCGYSTDPDYGMRLMDLIDYHELQQYDLNPEPDRPAEQVAA